MDSYKVDKKLNEVVKTLLDTNDKLIRIIDDDYGMVKLLPTHFSLSREKQMMKIEEEYKEFVKANSEYPVLSLGYISTGITSDIYKQRRFHAGEECCDLIVACLTYLRQNFSAEERSELFEFVNNKNRKRGYLEA